VEGSRKAPLVEEGLRWKHWYKDSGRWFGVCAAPSPGCPRTEPRGKHTRQLDGPLNGTKTTS